MGEVTEPILFKLIERQTGITVEDDARMYEVDGGWFKVLNKDHNKGDSNLSFLLNIQSIHKTYKSHLWGLTKKN